MTPSIEAAKALEILRNPGSALSDGEIVAIASACLASGSMSVEDIFTLFAANDAKTAGPTIVRIGNEIMVSVDTLGFTIKNFLDWAEHAGVLTLTEAGRAAVSGERFYALDS